MTTAAPQSPWTANSRPARHFAVLIGDDQGAFPADEQDIVRWLKLLRVTRPTGGQATHEIELQVLLDKLDARLQDTQTPTGHDRIVEVREIADDGNLDRIIAWGKVAAQDLELTDNSERVTVSARVDWYLMGPNRFDSYEVWDGAQSEVVSIHDAAVFNPVVDGTVRANKSDHKEGTDLLFAEWSAFETSNARDQQAHNQERWTIAEAVHTLIRLLNPDEDYLTNPTLSEITDQLNDEARDDLFVNHAIELDTTLPEALDSLLRPYGYWWSIEATGDIGSVSTSFVFGKLGEGVEQPLLVQRLNNTIDAGKTNIASEGVQIEYDIATNPNYIRCYASKEQREVTLKLYPAWATSDDSTTLSAINNETTTNHRVGDKRDIGRKWVLNEAGDYDGLRPEHNGVFAWPDDWLHCVRRRTLLPALTLDADGEQIGANGYRLRYYDSNSKIQEFDWSYSVLTQEIGVYLEGNVPSEVWNGFVASTNTHKYLEITAAIELDFRTIGLASRRSDAPNAKEVRFDLDVSDKFATRVYDETASIKSVFADDRTHTIVRVVHTLGSDTVFEISGDQTKHIKAGQQFAAADPTGATTPKYEGVYRTINVTYVAADDVTWLWIKGQTLPESDPASDYGTVYLNANIEHCGLRIIEYAKRVRDEQDAAHVAVAASLHGVDHPQYQLGDLITGLHDRNVSFDAFGGDANEYPQVLGITYNFDPPRTVLHLDEYLRDIELNPLPEQQKQSEPSADAELKFDAVLS